MSEPTSTSPEEGLPQRPLLLNYDAYTALRDPRARWVLPASCLGMLLAGVAQGLIFGAIKWHTARPGDDLAGVMGLIVPIGFAMFCWIFAALSLGPCLILRRKITKEVRYARFRTALIWGFLVGAPPWQAMTLFGEGIQSPTGELAWGIGVIGWTLIMPAVAGFFLCYRSAMRD